MATSDSEVLMVFGGEDKKGDFLTSLLIFNPRSNCWMELTTQLPRGLYQFLNRLGLVIVILFIWLAGDSIYPASIFWASHLDLGNPLPPTTASPPPPKFHWWRDTWSQTMERSAWLGWPVLRLELWYFTKPFPNNFHFQVHILLCLCASNQINM